MQASVSALPPPDRWNDHLMAHFTSMSADHHRGLIQDIHRKIRAFLPHVMQFDQQHPSYMQLEDVSSAPGGCHADPTVAHASCSAVPATSL